VISSGGAVSVTSSGVSEAVVVASGGKEVVLSGGRASATTISSGGFEDVVSSGVASGAVVLSGGSISGVGDFVGRMSDAGVAKALTIVSGGVVEVFSGGVASGLRLTSGAAISIASGGVASGAIVHSGGVVIDDGVAAFGGASVVFSGSLEGGGELLEDGVHGFVLSGAASAFTGEAVISAGALEIATSGGFGAADVSFEAGASTATLKIATADLPANGATFAPALADFNTAQERVDLIGRAYVKGAKASVSGDVLTVTDGTYKVKFVLSGGKAASYTVKSDDAGGTLITAVTAHASVMTQFMAALAPVAGAAPTSTVSAANGASPLSGLGAPTHSASHGGG